MKAERDGKMNTLSINNLSMFTAYGSFRICTVFNPDLKSAFYAMWNTEILHLIVLNSHCTQLHCTIFLVMTMAVKITWDLSTVTSCIDLSVRTVTKSPKVGHLYLYSPSLWTHLMIVCASWQGSSGGTDCRPRVVP